MATTPPARAIGAPLDSRRCAPGARRPMLHFCAAARECKVRMCAMTDITRSYRIRAYPNGAQRRLLDRWFGGVRWLWNTTLEIRSAAYRLICIEDLNVTALGRGKHARAIQDVAFSEIRRQLAYKCEWFGKSLRQLAGCDDRDPRVDARGACSEEIFRAGARRRSAKRASESCLSGTGAVSIAAQSRV